MKGFSKKDVTAGPSTASTARTAIKSDAAPRPKLRFSLRQLRRWGAPVAGLLLALGLLSRSYGTEVKRLDFNPGDPQVTRAEPMIIGANIHYGLRRILGYTSDDIGLNGLRDIGAESFRDYFPWASFSFDASGAHLVYSQRLMSFLGKTKLLPVLNLGMANPKVPGGVPPLTPEGFASFDAYVREAVRLTAAYKPIYEVWNEWNIYTGVGQMQPRMKGEGDPSDPRAAVHYLPVARSAVRAIREVAPEARILVGTVGDDIGWAWAKAIVRDGVLKGADGLSVHLYNQCLGPRDRNARELIRRVENLQEQLKPIVGGGQTPIYITEFGWPVFEARCQVDEVTAAHNFAQFILMAAPIDWIKGIWVHSLKDASPDPSDIEHRFGLLRYDNSPKPAVCFFREATDIVKAAQSLEVAEPFAGVFVARVRADGRQKLILWASSRFIDASFRVLEGEGKARLMCGDAVRTDANSARPLTTQPLIIDFDGKTPVKIEVTN